MQYNFYLWVLGLHFEGTLNDWILLRMVSLCMKWRIMQIAESGFLHGQAVTLSDITLLDAQHHTTQVYVNVFLLWNNCSVTVFIFCSSTPSSSSDSPDVCCELKWLSGQKINGFYIFWFPVIIIFVSFCDDEYQTQRIRNQFETIWPEIHFTQQLVHEKPRVWSGI